MPSASRVYARIGSVYAWASPDYIRDQMTEPQLIAYRHELNHAQEQLAKPMVYQLLEGIAAMLSPKGR